MGVLNNIARNSIAKLSERVVLSQVQGDCDCVISINSCAHALLLHQLCPCTCAAIFMYSCRVGHICMVGGGGGCSCMLLLHPVPTSADAGHDFCILCPDLCTLHPDLWTLCLWCFPSFTLCKHSTFTGGGCQQLQTAPLVLFYSATSADSPLAYVVVLPSVTCTGGAFSSIHWRKYCTCTRATCIVVVML